MSVNVESHSSKSPVPPLRNLTISLTRICNQACSHCWVDAGISHSEEMTNGQICNVLRQARELGAEHVKFTGGEPLLRRGIGDVLLFAVAFGLRVSVETNGTLLLPRFLSRIEEVLDRVHFYVSLDGAKDETHDSFRGQRGAFRKTILNLKELRDWNGYFSIHTVVRSQNLEEIPELHRLVCSLGASQHKLILSIHNMGRGSALQSDSIGPDELFSLLSKLPSQRFWDYNWSPALTRNTSLMTTLPPAFQSEGKAATCGWSQSFLSILADGAVALCQGLYEFEQAKVGNVLNSSLAEVWQEAPLLQETRSWSGRDLDGVCGNCAVADSCRGLCRASAISTYSELRAPYPLCQQLYEMGRFPKHMLVEPDVDCSYFSPSNHTIRRRSLPLTVVNRSSEGTD